MPTIPATSPQLISLPASGNNTDKLHLDQLKIEPEKTDPAQFRAALERHIQQAHEAKVTASKPIASNENSLGERIMARTNTMAEQVKNDQQHVSKMLEQASRNGDSMQMMKAMMALNDYQMRVQFISKTAAKASSSIDQLTKLQ